MNSFRALLTAIAVAAAPLSAAPPAIAQVNGADIQLATSAIMNAGSRAAKVKAIKKVPSVGVIRLDFNSMSPWSDLPTESDYRIMVSKNAGGVAKLQQALRSNPATRAHWRNMASTPARWRARRFPPTARSGSISSRVKAQATRHGFELVRGLSPPSWNPICSCLALSSADQWSARAV